MSRLTYVVFSYLFLLSVASAGESVNDIEALRWQLMSSGNGHFMRISEPLRKKLRIDQGQLNAVDPGIACELSGQGQMISGPLGRAGAANTVCIPDGTAQTVLLLADKSTLLVVCKGLSRRAKPAPAIDCAPWKDVMHPAGKST